jgi:hypothetical protein
VRYRRVWIDQRKGGFAYYSVGWWWWGAGFVAKTLAQAFFIGLGILAVYEVIHWAWWTIYHVWWFANGGTWWVFEMLVLAYLIGFGAFVRHLRRRAA